MSQGTSVSLGWAVLLLLTRWVELKNAHPFLFGARAQEEREMRGLKFWIIVIIICCSGCMTTNSFMKKVSNNTNSSPKEIKQILGNPYWNKSYHKGLTDGITEFRYKDSWTSKRLAILFYDDKIIYYGPYNKYKYLDVLYENNIINSDAYSKGWDLFKEDDEREQRMRVLRAQERAAGEQNRLAREQNRIARERLEIERRRVFSDSLGSVFGNSPFTRGFKSSTPQLAPDGSYVAGTPVLAPDGTYVGMGN